MTRKVFLSIMAAAAVVLALLYTGKLRHPPRYVDRESGEAQQDA